MTITKVLGWFSLREKGSGWLHQLHFEVPGTNGPKQVLIQDDTDYVDVTSSDEDVISIKDALSIWKEWGMGTSAFPCRPVYGEKKNSKPLPNGVYSGSGEDFCQAEEDQEHEPEFNGDLLDAQLDEEDYGFGGF